jgi:nitroreductase
MEVLESLKSIRSFRSSLDEPVDRETVGMMLEAARHAPSPANAQTVEFIVVESDSGLEELSELAEDDRLREVPTAVIVLADTGRMARRVGEADAEKSCFAEASCAAQNMRAVAAEQGIATAWITGMDAERAAERFRVPDGKVPQGVLGICHSNDTVEPESKFQLNEITFYEEYDNQLHSQFDDYRWRGLMDDGRPTRRRKESLLERIKRRLGLI